MAISEPSLTGQVLNGRYIIQGLIGAGGMGCVYRAHDQVLGRAVAVKTIFAHLSAQSGLAERFTREAKLLASVSHPHVLSVFDYGTSQARQLFLVMELLEGENLYDLVRARVREGFAGLDVRDVHDLLVKLCSGLAAVHDKGIVHRDLKPQNVFVVRRDGELHPVLLDFGIARSVESGAPATGAFVGTVDYASPEQLKELPDVDARADLYCLGVLAYECLGGRRPFSGSQVMIAQAHLSTPPPPLPPDVCPAPLWGLLAQLLEKDRSLRPQSARAVRDALRGLRDSLHLPPSPQSGVNSDSGLAGPGSPRTHVVGVSPLDEPVFIAREHERLVGPVAEPHTTAPAPAASAALQPSSPRRRGLAVSLLVGSVVTVGAVALMVAPSKERPEARSQPAAAVAAPGPVRQAEDQGHLVVETSTVGLVPVPSFAPAGPEADAPRPARSPLSASSPDAGPPTNPPAQPRRAPRPSPEAPAGPTGDNGTYL